MKDVCEDHGALDFRQKCTQGFLYSFLMLYSVHFLVNILPTSPASLSFSVAVKCNFWDIQSSEFFFYKAVPVLFDNIAPILPSTTEDTVWEDKRLIFITALHNT